MKRTERETLRLRRTQDDGYTIDKETFDRLGLEEEMGWSWDLDEYPDEEYWVETYEDINGNLYEVWRPDSEWHTSQYIGEWYLHIWYPDGHMVDGNESEARNIEFLDERADDDELKTPISTDDYCDLSGSIESKDRYYIRETLSWEEIDRYAELLYTYSDCRSDEPDDVEAKLLDMGFRPEDWEIEAVCDQIAEIEHMTRAKQNTVEKYIGWDHKRPMTREELEAAEEEYDEEHDDDDND